MSNQQNDVINEARFEAILDKWLALVKDPDEAVRRAEVEFNFDN